jgi:glycosyltransferase involved in cell wall biosynthesis
MSKPLISLIVPCWNEEQMVALFLTETSQAIKDIDADFEFIFIDDGSSDETYSALKKLADTDKRVRILGLSRNFGSFPAVSAGMHHAAGDAIICIAADLQDPPSLIAKLVESWQAGNDIVWAAIGGRGDYYLQTLFSGLFYSMIRRIALHNMPPHGMNVGLFSRRVIDIYNALPERDSIPFFTILKLGFPQAQISYDRQARRTGTSGWSFWARVRSAVDVVVTFSYAPVRLISTVGFLAAIIGVIYALVIIIQSLLFEVEVSGWSSLMVVLLLVSGIQMVTMGFIAEYLWRQSKQVRREPRYIVMNEYGSQSSKKPVSSVTDVDNINVSPDH